MRRALTLVLTFSAFCAPIQSQAQEPQACLGNNHEYTVAVGAQYTDRQGLWTCDPGANDATAGGWVLSPAPSATPAVMSTPVSEPTSAIVAEVLAEDAGSGGNALAVSGAIAVGIATMRQSTVERARSVRLMTFAPERPSVARSRLGRTRRL